MKLFIFVIFAMLAAAFASPQGLGLGAYTGTAAKFITVPGGAVVGKYKKGLLGKQGPMVLIKKGVPACTVFCVYSDLKVLKVFKKKK